LRGGIVTRAIANRRADMREIEFRGKRKDNRQWVSGYFVKDDAETPFIHAEAWAGKSLFAVIPETVGQYTGIKDKDGKKIFEGDIVRLSKDGKDKSFIMFYNGSFYAADLKCYGEKVIEKIRMIAALYWGGYRRWTPTIIGNLWDTPELLGRE
jgi:uncharacterized phage protein (TIGR01671 family)